MNIACTLMFNTNSTIIYLLVYVFLIGLICLWFLRTLKQIKKTADCLYRARNFKGGNRTRLFSFATAINGLEALRDSYKLINIYKKFVNDSALIKRTVM